MPPRYRTAITLPGLSGNVADTLALARRAESAGYDDLWLAAHLRSLGSKFRKMGRALQDMLQGSSRPD